MDNFFSIAEYMCVLVCKGNKLSFNIYIYSSRDKNLKGKRDACIFKIIYLDIEIIKRNFSILYSID